MIMGLASLYYPVNMWNFEYIPTGQMLAVRPAIVRFRDQGLKIIDWRRLQAPPVTNNCYGEKHRAENYMDLFMTGLISL